MSLDMGTYTLDGVPLDDPAGRWGLSDDTKLNPLPAPQGASVAIPGVHGVVPTPPTAFGAGSHAVGLIVTDNTPAGAASGSHQQMRANLSALYALAAPMGRLPILRYFKSLSAAVTNYMHDPSTNDGTVAPWSAYSSVNQAYTSLSSEVEGGRRYLKTLKTGPATTSTGALTDGLTSRPAGQQVTVSAEVRLVGDSYLTPTVDTNLVTDPRARSTGRWGPARMAHAATAEALDGIDTSIRFTANVEQVGQYALGGGSANVSGGQMAAMGIPVVANTSYRFGFTLKSETHASTYQVLVYWYDAAGMFLSTTSGGMTAVAIGGVQRFAFVATSPANAAYTRFGPAVGTSGGNGYLPNGATFLFSRAFVGLSASVVDYFDGTTADTKQAEGRYDFDWTGTVNESTSTRTFYPVHTAAQRTAGFILRDNANNDSAVQTTTDAGAKDWANLPLGVWTRIYFTTTIKAARNLERLYVYRNGYGYPNETELDVRDVMLTDGATLHDPFSGDTAPTADYSFAWLGAAYASASQRVSRFRYAVARLLAGVEPTMEDPFTARVVLPFDLPSVFWRDSVQAEASSASGSTWTSTPAELDGTTGVITDPVFRCAGPLTRVVVTDTASGKTLTWDGNLTAGQYLRIHADTLTAFVTTTDTWTGGNDVSGGLSVGPRGFDLNPDTSQKVGWTLTRTGGAGVNNARVRRAFL